MQYLVISLVFVAATTDLKTGRIPNWLTLPALLLGIVWQAVADGMTGAALSLLGALCCGVVPWLMHRMTKGQAIGGGDIKLFAALGAWLGPVHGLEVELSAFLFLGILALAQLSYQGALLRVLINSLTILLNPLLPEKKRRKIAPESLTEMRMGPAIALATTLFVVRATYAVNVPWPI